MKYFVLDFSQNISKNEDLVQFIPINFCKKTLKNEDFLKGTPYGFLSKNIKLHPEPFGSIGAVWKISSLCQIYFFAYCLTVLSTRLGRKRCCDTTPDRCLECNRLTILTAHC